MGNQVNTSNLLCCGLINARSIIGKVGSLSFFISTHKLDVVFITESWLTEDITDSFFTPNGYISVRYDRPSHGGGVIIILRESLTCCPITVPNTSSEITCIDVFNQFSRVRLICSYHAQHKNCFQTTTDVLSLLLDVEYPIIIAGDLNAPHISWAHLSSACTNCSKLLSFAIKNGFIQHVNEPTRGDNILDLVFSNTPYLIDSLTVDVHFSDHRAVLFNVLFNTSSAAKSPRLNFRSANYQLINQQISSVNWFSVLLLGDVQDMYSRFEKIVGNIVSNNIQSLVKNSNTHLPLEIRRLFKNKRRIWRAEGNSPRYKSITKKIKTKIKRWELYKEKSFIFKSSSESPQIASSQFYKYFKNKTSSSTYIPPLMFNGTEAISPEEKAEVFANQFSSVFTHDDGLIPVASSKTGASLTQIRVAPHEVEKELSRLKSSFSVYTDGIPSFVLKQCATSLALPLCLIYNHSLHTASVPLSWKVSHIIPIFKKGKKTEPSNYRPISLGSNYCKVLERLIKRQVHNFLHSHNLFSSSQYGFLEKRSTVSNIIHYLHHLVSANANKLSSDAILIDLQKAFDTVVHQKLVQKLSTFGIKNQLLSWISDWLSNRTQLVKIGASFSSPHNVISGVPQGSVLGPTLFLLYINDICDTPLLSSSTTFLFADDLKIVSSFPSSSQSSLQPTLTYLEEWFKTWQLKVATPKSAVLHFGKQNPNTSYHLCGLPIPSCSSIRDLGFRIDTTLKMSVHINNIVSQATRKTNMLFLVFKSKNPTVLLKAYTVYVRSILEYGTPVYSPSFTTDVKSLEHVQLSFLKRLCVRCNIKFTNYKSLCKRFNLETLYYRRRINDLCFLYNINLNDNVSNLHISNLFAQRSTRTRGQPCKLYPLFPCSTNIQKHFFTCRVLDDWNKLPAHVLTYSSVTTFRSFVKTVFLDDFSYD